MDDKERLENVLSAVYKICVALMYVCNKEGCRFLCEEEYLMAEKYIHDYESEHCI